MQDVNFGLDKKIIEGVIHNKKTRKALAHESHYWFFNMYFSEHVSYETAPFQKEIFQLTEDTNNRLSVIVSFRGSGKTTIVSNSLPIWSVIGKLQKKYVLILCKTQETAKRTMRNIKEELESNDLLRSDLGPFQEEPISDWNASSILISNFDARITVASIDQSFRGTKHRAHRPDLIILDDVEDLDSVRSRESRDKLYQSFTGDVVPLGDKTTHIFIIGNLLHEDSLVMRLKKSIENGDMDGVYKEYPLLNDNDQILWPGKYPTMEDIEKEKRRIGNNISWNREFLLRILPSEAQIIYPEWIFHYDELPNPSDRTYELIYTITGIDLAISEKETADYTAMVTAKIYRHHTETQWYIYILPYVVNERLQFSEILNKAEHIVKSHTGQRASKIVIETVGFQQAASQQLKNRGLHVKDFVPHGDKHSRLMSISHMIETGHVRFPQKGCERLIQQLTGFGVERHDDLMDALVMLVLEVIKTPIRPSFYTSDELVQLKGPKRNWYAISKFNSQARPGTIQQDIEREKYGTIMGNLWKEEF